MGIGGALLTWIRSFLSERKQCVVVDYCYSSWVEVISGVPQGSVLGPILFLIFINDVAEILDNQTSCSLFADDLKIYSAVDVNTGHFSLQNSLDRLVQWCCKWQMAINVSKTFVLHFGKSNPCYDYRLNGIAIRSVFDARDLGVIIDSELLFSLFDKHVDSLVKKAYMRIGILFRSFVTRDVRTLRQAYVTFIRPILEYASTVWSPYKVKHITAIERIQRHFTRRIPSLHELSYSERLAVINLDTLELRRLRADLLMYYKILNGLSPLTANEYFTVTVNDRVTRSSDKLLLSKPSISTNVLENDFFVRRINCWNELPDSVKRASSINVFKSLVSRIDLSRYLIVEM